MPVLEPRTDVLATPPSNTLLLIPVAIFPLVLTSLFVLMETLKDL